MVNFDEVAGRGRGQYPPGKHVPGPPYPTDRKRVTRMQQLEEARNIIVKLNFHVRVNDDWTETDSDDLDRAEQLLRQALSPSATIDEALDQDYIDDSLDLLE